jgi:hypothetical protein
MPRSTLARAALKRALRNLIENPVKYGHRADVRLTAAAAKLKTAANKANPLLNVMVVQSVPIGEPTLGGHLFLHVASYPAPTLTRIVPIPSICAVITSPGFTGPTPCGVPVRITSPGCSV